MELKLEVVPIPVTDVDRAKAFYVERVGFVEDHDVTVSEKMRVVQLTPPGSECSVVIGTGIIGTPPGSVQGLHLVVAGRGGEVGEIQDAGGGVYYVAFDDPDGNGWILQQYPHQGG